MYYNDDKKINRAIRKLMIDKGYNIIGLSNVLEVSKQTVSNTLSARTNWSLETLEQYAKVLGYSIKVSFVDDSSGEVMEVR